VTLLPRVCRHAAILLLVSLAGCAGCYRGPFELHISMDREGFQKQLGTIPSIEVNVVAVNNAELSKWSGKNISEFWRPDEPLRLDAFQSKHAIIVTFGEAKRRCMIVDRQTRFDWGPVLTRKDPIWRFWEKEREATTLFVVSNYPRSAAGASDSRRVILPLAREQWAGYYGKKRVLIEVRPSGLWNHTPTKVGEND